jgi:hypothetical protein
MIILDMYTKAEEWVKQGAEIFLSLPLPHTHTQIHISSCHSFEPTGMDAKKNKKVKKNELSLVVMEG